MDRFKVLEKLRKFGFALVGVDWMVRRSEEFWIWDCGGIR